MALEGLKLTTTPQKQAGDPASKRRMRLIMQIEKQMSLADSNKQGRTVRGCWWTLQPDMTRILSIKYGKVALELAKGKHAIVCSDHDELLKALQTARTATLDGSFDSQIGAISEKVRARFKKAKAGK